jgi:hypothetical protein
MTSFIVGLLNCSRPSAIFLCVISIYVNSVEGSSFLSYSHVFKKVLEFKPSFTDLDSPATIQVKLKVVRVSASLLHSVPASVSSGAFLSCHSVGCHSRATNIGTKTPAALSFFVSQFAQVYANSTAAITVTDPICLARCGFVKTRRDQSPKPNTSHVDFVVTSTRHASARFSSVASQRIGRDRGFVPALTYAQPSGSSKRIVFTTFNNSQFMKCLSSKVFKFTHRKVSLLSILTAKTNIRKAFSDVNQEEAANV